MLHNRYRATGGEERSVSNLVEMLSRHGHAVTLLERSSADLGRVQAARALTRGGVDPEEVSVAVERFGADLVHAHNVHPLFGWRALAAAGAAVPQLGKSLHARHVTMITIGGIIGAGLFVSSSASIAITGPAVIVSYGLAGLIMLVVMRMLSEMAAAYPAIGGFYEYNRLALGELAGFMTGWMYWYFWVIVVALEAVKPREKRSRHA